MLPYNPRSPQDMRRLATDLVGATPVQRGCAVLYAYRSGILRPPIALRTVIAGSILRHGERRGLAVVAANLSRKPEILDPLWDSFLICLARGVPEGDGVTQAKVDGPPVRELVDFMRRLGWRPATFENSPAPRPISGTGAE